MLTILETRTCYFEIKKSRFISVIFHTETQKDFEERFMDVKKNHPKADHIVYAYVLDSKNSGLSDANEPKGTAGRPVLNVIEKNNLAMVSVFVIRFFGGIKLGAGGLARAYSRSASELISMCEKKTLCASSEVEFESTYENADSIINNASNLKIKIVERIFSERVRFRAIVSVESAECLKKDKNVQNFSCLRENFFYCF